MTVSEFIKQLQKLEADGHGELELVASHGASGAFDSVGYPSLKYATENDNAMGLDMDAGKPYISVYVGN